MKKPKKIERTGVMDYHKMIEFIEDKYNIKVRNYANNPDIPCLDYWHWLINNYFHEVTNGDTYWWDIDEILDSEDGDTPKWALEITQLVYDEFKDELDEDGGINVLIKW